MQAPRGVRFFRAVRLPLLITLVLSSTAALISSGAAERAPEVLTGTVWSTDVDGNGTTSLFDLSVFSCAYLGGICHCKYTQCAPSPPAPPCNAACPEAFPPCFCGSGIPASKCDFTCDGDVRLPDFSIMAYGYLLGTQTGKCPP